MATSQMLKKKLKGILSIQKVSKALKTASTVKFSKLSTVWNNYAVYADKCRSLYRSNPDIFEHVYGFSDPEIPPCIIVMAGNKGMCGSFNIDLLNFAKDYIQNHTTSKIFLCGKKTENWFKENNLPYERAFIFNDIPSYEEVTGLADIICPLLRKGEISNVELIYPKYHNMLKQVPVCFPLIKEEEFKTESILPLFFPDRERVVQGMADKLLTTFIYEKVLECSLGAQAATLMTMRSSYDTATEYSRQLTGEINRIRQSRVTADVLDTASEFTSEVD